VLLLAFVIGLIAGGLTYAGEHSLPNAVLFGSGAAGAALLLFHTIISR
jgi:hypothetical protein